MSKLNGARSGCRDVFHANILHDAKYDGFIEIPVIEPESLLPNRLISFSKALRTDDYDQWVHFYEDDALFERVWNRPTIYLKILQRFNGVITPDFSLYRDMPLAMQQWNTFRGKALGQWWQKNGIHVIPNVRFGDERTYPFCCNGIRKNTPICIGSHGCIRIRSDKEYFKKGLNYVVNHLNPSYIIIYGSIPDDVFSFCHELNIPFLQFDSDYSISHQKENA